VRGTGTRFTAWIDGDVILFPGQGSQSPGMRESVARTAPDLLELACELVGDDPFARLEHGTRFVQPAVFCASVVSWRQIADRVRPAAFAGHSLGEYAALVAAGALDVRDALRLVVLRGRITGELGSRLRGGMLALLGVDQPAATEIARRCRVTVANDNCPGQIVLSGRRWRLRWAGRKARRKGVKTAFLAVDGPFHSPLMEPAVEPFARELAGIRFGEPRLPVYSSVSALPFDDIPARLAESLVSPVRWRDVIERLGADGARRFVEVAPGSVLADMIRRTIRGGKGISVERDGVDAVAGALPAP
jgi:[acyl-carrier-protein] S-malonyltransferase